MGPRTHHVGSQELILFSFSALFGFVLGTGI